MLRQVLDDHTQLRLLRPEDADELFALIDANRSHLRPWFEMVDATREASDTAAWIGQTLAGRADNPARGWFGIFHHDRLVGCAGVAESDFKKRTAEIGYYLAADACGKGLATRACRALVDHLFNDLHLHRVGLQVASTNRASIRLAERLGFVLEGRLREADQFDDQRRDVLVDGILRDEWARAAAPPTR